MSKTALIILNYNNVEDTINCIESVERYNTAPVKIIVVDNGSTRARVAVKLDSYLRQRFRQKYTRINEGAGMVWPYLNYVTFLVSKRNDGYARGQQQGAAACRCRSRNRAGDDPQQRHTLYRGHNP